jgi:hypothetical protein
MRITLCSMTNGEDSASSGTSPGEGDPPRGSRFSVVRSRFDGPRSLAEPLIIIVIGIALGLVDQTSSEVSGMLRVPALIAALILVGQGIYLIELRRRAPVVVTTTARVGNIEESTATALALAQNKVVVAGAEEDAAAPAASDRTRAYLVLGLAVWLGVATLAYPAAPLALILLSLLAAYLLFARGWQMLHAGTAAD